MTTPADLITWLRAALDDDARLIERNSGERGVTDEGIFPDYRTYDGEDLNTADAYLVGFNPARMRAEVDAKRRILDLAAPVDDPNDDEQVWYQQAISDVVRHLALPYADRPGFREEWRPA